MKTIIQALIISASLVGYSHAEEVGIVAVSNTAQVATYAKIQTKAQVAPAVNSMLIVGVLTSAYVGITAQLESQNTYERLFPQGEPAFMKEARASMN